MYYLHYNDETGAIIGAPYHSDVHGKIVPIFNTEPITSVDSEGNENIEEIGKVQTGTTIDLSAIPEPRIGITDIEHQDFMQHIGYRKIDVVTKQLIECVPPSRPLEEIKDEKWNEIKNIRDQKEQSGVTYMGKVLDSDTLSVQRISIAVQAAQTALAAGQDFAIDWTCADNTTLSMTAEEVIGIPVALAHYSNSLHQIARELREQIEKATNEDELAATVWPE